MGLTVERHSLWHRNYINCIISITLCILLVVLPVIFNSKVHAVVTDTLIGFLIAILIACGFTFTISQSDIVPILEDLIEEFLSDTSSQHPNGWPAGGTWWDALGVYNHYLSMTPELFAAGEEFVDWAQNNGKLPSGTVSTPRSLYLEPSSYIFDSEIKLNNTTLISNYKVPVYQESDFTVVQTSFLAPYLTLYVPKNTIYSPITLSYSTDCVVGNTINLISNGITYSATFTNNPYLRLLMSFLTPPNYSLYPTNVNIPIYLIYLNHSGQATPALIYTATNGLQYLLYGFGNYDRLRIPIINSQSSISVESSGVPSYSFNNSDRIYIDLQQGNLSTALSALQNLINQLNQNLIQATIALQEASSSNLPIDTSPFTQLVTSYENVTNDCISGNISVSSALSSMYTLLSSSIASINNPSLEDACINAYNAFVNKLSLFQSGGGSGSWGDYTSVQTFQSTLNTISSSISSGTLSLVDGIASASSSLSYYINGASGMQEIIGLNSVYNNFLSSLGLSLELSTSIQSYLTTMTNTLDSYYTGSLDRSGTLSSLRTAYKNGLSASKTAQDIGSISAAYQAAIDQVAVSEFNISQSLGDVSYDTIALEDDLVGDFDLVEFQSLLDFETWQLMPAGEASLYREYFQMLFDDQSPFHDFLYYPLVLGLCAILLGTGIGLSRRRRTDSEPDTRPLPQFDRYRSD